MLTGNHLRAARAMAGLEQTDLAERAGLHVNSIRNMEAAGAKPIGGRADSHAKVIAALEGARLGYDVRVLADLTVARVEADRSLVLDRLALHGVLATTVRQTLLEWAICLDDPILKQRVLQLLS